MQEESVTDVDAHVASDAHDGPPDSSNPDYVRWLVQQSMLRGVTEIARHLSGTHAMWQHRFALAQPRAAVDTASVWFTAYPSSLINAPGQSFLSTLGTEALWSVFREIGIDAVHTGPVKCAGGLRGWERTPSVDGHFDRCSLDIDPVLGTADEFRSLCEVATEFGGTVIDDIIPGHTGKGADFRLAEMAHSDYPGVYHMVEIPPDDWHLLPNVPLGIDSVNLDVASEAVLSEAGYIVGAMSRVIFQAPGVKETNWSVTPVIRGVDGVDRRWVYLHYFKEGQPSINWLDPTFAGMRLVIGDALHALCTLGAGGLRLDANGFLGIERGPAGAPAWSEGHPVSDLANQVISNVVRKVGGFTFQELNLSIDDIKRTSETGPDLSYDFITRPAYHHALITGDTEFLRLCLRESRRLGVDPVSLVHALQNHDELTYELVHFASAHADDVYEFRGTNVPGSELAETIRFELSHSLTGPTAPYNLVFTTNGVACTTASVAAAALGFDNLESLDDRAIGDITRAHLLLARYNALQPGVFALSGWDLCGMLPLEGERVSHLLADGDTRWINRGAYDLLGSDPDAESSSAGMPRGRSLYGTLSHQLDDPTSFASSLRELLTVRGRLGLALARQIDIPDVPCQELLVMVHELPGGQIQATVLNFGRSATTGSISSEFFGPGLRVIDAASGLTLGEVDERNSCALTLAPLDGLSLVFG